MNVIGSRPTGWWRNRTAAMARLVDDLQAFAGKTGEPVSVVFDGEPREISGAARGVEVAFAPGGRDAADDEIARRVQGDEHPYEITVVTSDTALTARVRAAGAEVVGAGSFRRRLDDLG